MNELYPGIFCNEITLPKNPLRSLNCYLIPSEKRNLIIDTGFNQDECKNDFLSGIEELKIKIKKTDILLTHLHSDHIGLASMAESMGARIWAGVNEREAILSSDSDEYWQFFYPLMKMYGLEKYGVVVEDHPGYRYRQEKLQACGSLSEGDMINVGDYSFEVVDLPGHTFGQIGLYERKQKLFFCGDHILDSITPNIICWDINKDALGVYLESLHKVYDYEIDFLFTSHRQIIRDHRRRIDELLTHHDERLDECETIISDIPKCSCEVAAEMKWDLKVEKWLDFPKAQKWFSAGEAMAHLEHLVYSDRAERIKREDVIYYLKKSKNE